jgi:predicted transcriptional regulator
LSAFFAVNWPDYFRIADDPLESLFSGGNTECASSTLRLLPFNLLRLNILQRKGRVKRKLIGKAYEYRPALSRDKAIREALGDMLDRVFGGSVEALLMSLVKSRQLDAGRLVKVQQLIEEHTQADREGKHE